MSLTATAQNLTAGTYTGSISLIPASGGSPTLVPVTFIVKPSGTATPQLQLGQSSVSVTYQTGTNAPALQDVTITSTTGGALYTATAAAPWLKLVSTFNPLPSSSITDIAPGIFHIQTDPTGLNPGTYVDTINITSPGFPSIALPVTLTVTTSPALNAQPSSVILDDTLQTQATITVTSTGTSKLSFTAAAASAGGWLSVTPPAGSTDSGSQVLTVMANVNALQNGTYNGSITLTPSGGAPPLTIPVRLTVSNGNSATVTFITQPSPITLTGIVGQRDPTQAVFVSGSTNSSIDFTAYTTSTGGWLVAEPFRSSTPAQIVVRAKSNAVPGAGTYTGSVILTAVRTGDQMTIPVSFTLASQAIVSDTSMLTFTQQKKGVAPPPQQITITSNVANSTYTVGDLPAWLHVQPSRGSTPATVQVWVDIAVLPPGSNTATIQIAGPSNNIAIPVTASTLPPASLVVSQSAVSLPYQIGQGAPSPISVSVTSGSADEQIRFVAAATTTLRDFVVVGNSFERANTRNADGQHRSDVVHPRAADGNNYDHSGQRRIACDDTGDHYGNRRTSRRTAGSERSNYDADSACAWPDHYDYRYGSRASCRPERTAHRRGCLRHDTREDTRSDRWNARTGAVRAQ